MQRGDDLSSLKVGDEVYISFCDTGGGVVYGSEGVVVPDEEPNSLAVKNGIRLDKFKHIDGFYTFVKKI